MKPVEILLVEDNQGDIKLTLESFGEGKISNLISVVEDGELAVAYLRKEGVYSNAITPDIVLLDLNLPKIDGREVLSIIKKDAHLRHIPVVVLTTSIAEEDVVTTYNNYANCYIRKPVDLEKFIEVVHKVEDFWLTIVKLPPNDDKK